MEKELKDLVESEVASIKEQEQVQIEFEKPNLPTKIEPNELATETFAGNSAVGVIHTTKDRILEEAEKKINQEKIIDKHSTKLSKVADTLMEVETEKAAIEVRKKDADNRAEKQEIKNRLIVLRNEAKRLRLEEKHKNSMQKLQIKSDKKRIQWERLEKTLTPLGYDYVPNPIALHILLMLVGIKAFVNGVGEVGTAVLKCLKWIIFLGLAITIVLIIPVSREWFLELLGFLR